MDDWQECTGVTNLAFAKVLDIVVAQEIFLEKLIQFGLVQYTITED